MNKKSLFKIFDDFTSRQISKISSILDPGVKDGSPMLQQSAAPNRTATKSGNPEGIAAALDIGSSKIRVVVGRLSEGGQVEVIALAEANCDGLIRGAISNINKVSTAIQAALAAASAQANINIKEVYGSFSGTLSNHIEHGVLLRNDLATEINATDIFKLRQEMFNSSLPAGERLIYLQAKPFTIDSEPGIIEPIGMAGQRIEADFQLVTANATSIDYLYKCCAQANVSLREVMPSAIASAEALLWPEEMEDGVAVINIGAAVTSIAVYKKGSLLHTENFPLGGNNISLDIRDFTGLQLKQAELLKNQFGHVKPEEVPLNEIIEVKILNGTKVRQVSRKELCEVIKSRVEELLSIAFTMITDALKGERLNFGIVLTGGVSSMPYVKELANEVTAMQCHLGSTTLHLAPKDATAAESLDILKAPAYATAIGLLRTALQNQA